MTFKPEPDEAGFYDLHCGRCYKPVRSKSLGAIGFRCRSCSGPILPGTASQYERYLQTRPPAKPLNSSSYGNRCHP